MTTGELLKWDQENKTFVNGISTLSCVLLYTTKIYKHILIFTLDISRNIPLYF